MATGKITAIRGVVVDVEFPEGELPEIYEALNVEAPQGQLVLECSNIWAAATCARWPWVPPTACRAAGPWWARAPIRVPVGPVTLGRIFNVIGEAVDGRPTPSPTSTIPSTAPRRVPGAEHNHRDVRNRPEGHRPVGPVHQGRQDRHLRRERAWARRSPSPNSSAPWPRSTKACRSSPAWASGRARAPTSTTRCRNMACRTQTIDGLRPDERDAGRAPARGPDRRPWPSIFCDEGRDVLLFIDNIFRYVLAGSEMSALLGRMPSAGLPADAGGRMGALQERITSTPGDRSRRCRPSTPPPTTSDPAPVATFAHLDAIITLERSVFARGIFPAVDRGGLHQPRPPARRGGRFDYRTAREVKRGVADLQGTCGTSSPSWASTS